MNWADKLQKIDPRIIYTVLLIGLIIPLIWPIGIPLTVHETTQDVYDLVAALDPATDVVLVTFDYAPGSAPDVHPSAVAIVEHLMQRGIRWVGVSFFPDGPQMSDLIIRDLEARGYVYGEHFIDLGFKAGAENAVAALARNARVIPLDVRGIHIDTYDMMDGIYDMTDFGIVIGNFAGTPGVAEYVRQVVDPLGVRLVASVVTVIVPSAMPFFESGQLAGLLQGLRGAAEYELLTGIPGQGAAKMDAQSIGHLIIVAFILVGNVAYFVGKKKKK